MAIWKEGIDLNSILLSETKNLEIAADKVIRKLFFWRQSRTLNYD